MAREHDFIFGSSDFIVGQKHFWATSNSEAATSLPEMTVSDSEFELKRIKRLLVDNVYSCFTFF